MSRIAPLPYDQWDDEIKKLARGDNGPSAYEEATLGIMAKTPKLLKAMFSFQAALVRYGSLSPKLREMIRLRVAFHNQCRSCMATRYQVAIDDGLTEGLVCSLEKPEESPDLTPREKAALAYADISSTDHFSPIPHKIAAVLFIGSPIQQDDSAGLECIAWDPLEASSDRGRTGAAVATSGPLRLA